MPKDKTTPERHCGCSLYHRPRDAFVRPPLVAAAFGCSESKLEAMRANGGGPPFIKPTQRQVLYQVGDALDYLSAHPKLRSTSDPAAVLRRHQERGGLEGWLFNPANRGAKSGEEGASGEQHKESVNPGKHCARRLKGDNK